MDCTIHVTAECNDVGSFGAGKVVPSAYEHCKQSHTAEAEGQYSVL